MAVQGASQQIGNVIAPHGAFLFQFANVFFNKVHDRNLVVSGIAQETQQQLHVAVARSPAQGSANVNMGRGAIVIGLASVIIGEVIFGARFNFAWQLGAIVAGSAIYQIVIAFVLQLGLSTEDLKLFSAVTVAVALSVPTLQKKFRKTKVVPAQAEKE